jgi:hypothetical protein
VADVGVSIVVEETERVDMVKIGINEAQEVTIGQGGMIRGAVFRHVEKMITGAENIGQQEPILINQVKVVIGQEGLMMINQISQDIDLDEMINPDKEVFSEEIRIAILGKVDSGQEVITLTIGDKAMDIGLGEIRELVEIDLRQTGIQKIRMKMQVSGLKDHEEIQVNKI